MLEKKNCREWGGRVPFGEVGRIICILVVGIPLEDVLRCSVRRDKNTDVLTS